MTIEDLYTTCDLINIYTKMYIIDSDQAVKAWATEYGNLPYSIATLVIDHFTVVGNDEVVVWIP